MAKIYVEYGLFKVIHRERIYQHFVYYDSTRELVLLFARIIASFCDAELVIGYVWVNELYVLILSFKFDNDFFINSPTAEC